MFVSVVPILVTSEAISNVLFTNEYVVVTKLLWSDAFRIVDEVVNTIVDSVVVMKLVGMCNMLAW